jgi:hypothetical protein
MDSICGFHARQIKVPTNRCSTPGCEVERRSSHDSREPSLPGAHSANADEYEEYLIHPPLLLDNLPQSAEKLRISSMILSPVWPAPPDLSNRRNGPMNKFRAGQGNYIGKLHPPGMRIEARYVVMREPLPIRVRPSLGIVLPSDRATQLGLSAMAPPSAGAQVIWPSCPLHREAGWEGGGDLEALRQGAMARGAIRQHRDSDLEPQGPVEVNTTPLVPNEASQSGEPNAC